VCLNEVAVVFNGLRGFACACKPCCVRVLVQKLTNSPSVTRLLATVNAPFDLIGW
jgi:hypothetical protein